MNDIPFHDSTIRGIEIWTRKDHFDCITIIVENSDFSEIFDAAIIHVEFVNCYWIKTDFVTWFIGEDSIRSFEVLDNSPMLNKLIELNSKGFGPRHKSIKHYNINLNTSNGNIDVLAEDVKFRPIDLGVNYRYYRP